MPSVYASARRLLLICTCFTAWTGFAEVRFSPLFQSGMVLQRETKIPFWGFAKSLEEITIQPDWPGAEAVTVKCPNHGRWEVELSTPQAGGPYTIVVQGHNRVTLENVLIGDLWLCSGQSNMEWTLDGAKDGAAAVAASANDQIRLLQVKQASASTPQQLFQGSWEPCTPSSSKSFSAVGYFFGAKLQQETGIPIGLINASWGGTPAETWTPAEVIAQDTDLAYSASFLKEVPWCPTAPGLAYNAMIQPLLPFAVKGVIWYQGCANTINAFNYEKTLTTLIATWRQRFHRPDMPFYFVQIAPYAYGDAYSGSLVREQQLRAMDYPGVGMVVTADCVDDTTDIHPTDKRPVGERLARWALAKQYGRSIAYSGPIYREMKAEKKAIRLYFDHAEGMTSRDGKPLSHFEIAGPDRLFYPASAKIEGHTIVVTAKQVPHPVAVRYAFRNTDQGNLVGMDHLPASPFRTDDWETILFTR